MSSFMSDSGRQRAVLGLQRFLLQVVEGAEPLGDADLRGREALPKPSGADTETSPGIARMREADFAASRGDATAVKFAAVVRNFVLQLEWRQSRPSHEI